MAKRKSVSGIRNKLVAGAIVVVGLATIAYAAFSQSLSVNGSGTASGNWNVAITNITQASQTGVTENSAPTHTGTSASFDVDLAYPGATAQYDVTVTNSGSIPAKLSSITDLTSINAAAPTYITYTETGVTAGTTTLAANGGTNVLHVTVTWNGASAPSSTGASKAATITLNYDQNT
ncbi:MAG TPA: hypothetical protein VLF91_00645 [Candidatus Saccharimonadales bacterium]|nr:hypothetical protein [Candidatus Saccharimonadales bacterium]